MATRRIESRLDAVTRAARDRDYRRIAELWRTPDRGPDVDACIFRIFVRVTDTERANGVGLVEILQRLPADMAAGIRRHLANHLGRLAGGSGQSGAETT